MPKLISTKAGELTIAEAFMIGIAKQVEERLLARTIIGNGSYISGGAKIVGALMTNKIDGKFGKIVSTALVIDGTEDIIINLLSGGLGFIGGGNNANATI